MNKQSRKKGFTLVKIKRFSKSIADACFENSDVYIIIYIVSWLHSSQSSLLNGTVHFFSYFSQKGIETHGN